MLGLEKYRAPHGVPAMRDTWTLFESLGYTVPPEKCAVLCGHIDAKRSLRCHMRFRAWVGYSRAEIQRFADEAAAGLTYLQQAFTEEHTAVEAVRTRKILLNYVIGDLHDIEKIAREVGLTQVVEDVKEELERGETMADVLRKAMAQED